MIQALKDKLKFTIEFDDVLGWSVYDHIVEGVLSDREKAAKSDLVDIISGGKIVVGSRRTLDHAINSPLGMVTEGLLNVVADLRKEGALLPNCIKSRMDQLLKLQGESSDHVISICMSNLNCLMDIDPEWVKELLIPKLDLQHPASEPVWNGLLRVELLSPKLAQTIKPYLLNLVPKIEDFTWGQYHAETVALWLLNMNIFEQDQPNGLTNNEMRTALRSMSDVTRNWFIYWLGHVGREKDNGWTNLVVPFISDVWPRDVSLKTPSSVMEWIKILGRSGDSFPAVFKAVKEFLIPVEMRAFPLYPFTKGDHSMVVRFPEQMLDLIDRITLNYPQPSYFYKIREILDTIVDTNPELKWDSKYRKLIDLIERNDQM